MEQGDCHASSPENTLSQIKLLYEIGPFFHNDRLISEFQSLSLFQASLFGNSNDLTEIELPVEVRKARLGQVSFADLGDYKSYSFSFLFVQLFHLMIDHSHE